MALVMPPLLEVTVGCSHCCSLDLLSGEPNLSRSLFLLPRSSFVVSGDLPLEFLEKISDFYQMTGGITAPLRFLPQNMLSNMPVVDDGGADDLPLKLPPPAASCLLPKFTSIVVCEYVCMNGGLLG